MLIDNYIIVIKLIVCMLWINDYADQFKVLSIFKHSIGLDSVAKHNITYLTLQFVPIFLFCPTLFLEYQVGRKNVRS